MSRHPLRALATVLVPVLAAGALGACSTGRERPSAAPSTTTAPAASPAPSSTCTATPEQSVGSYAPTPQTTAAAAQAQTIRKDRLVAGVASDVYLMGFRNPETAGLEGFDIDLLREIARALFGDPDRIEFKVITNAQRIPALVNGEVDIVGRAMTINCARWEQINFSAEYLRSGQRLLVSAEDAPRVGQIGDLAGRPVCGVATSTAEDTLRAHPEVTAVTVKDNSDCMVAFQQGTVDAIVSDGTILAGFAAQDPYARVVGAPFTQEPYGFGIRRENVELTRFVNAVLDDVRRRSWSASYDRWLAPTLGPASPPVPAYGR